MAARYTARECRRTSSSKAEEFPSRNSRTSSSSLTRDLDDRSSTFVGTFQSAGNSTFHASVARSPALFLSVRILPIPPQIVVHGLNLSHDSFGRLFVVREVRHRDFLANLGEGLA